MSEQNSSPFMQTDKISDNKYDSLIDMGEEIYRATVGEALPVSSKETYERILKIHESGEYDMAFWLDDVDSEEWDDDLGEFYPEDYSTLLVFVVAYESEKNNDAVTVARILMSENSELDQFFVHWFPDEN